MSLSTKQKMLLKSLLETAREVSETFEYVSAFTALIGVLSACDILKMKWSPSTGYNCIDKNGGKVKVKSRRDSKGGLVNKGGRLGKFGIKRGYGFKRGLYVELNRNFEVVAIYESSKSTLQKLENKEKNGKALHVGTFLKYAGEPIYHNSTLL